jgi:hypothetical protein
MLGGNYWKRSGSEGRRKRGLRFLHRGPAGVGCSEDERQGPGDVEAHAKANLGAARPIRDGAWSGGVKPGGSECHVLVDELLQAGYLQRYPSPSLTAHGLYRLTDSGVSAADEAALIAARRRARIDDER